MMSYREEIKFMMDFARESDYEEYIVRKQIRALWTAFCLHFGREPDTASYDTELLELFGAVKEKHTVQFEAFDLFMGELLS